jgi:hypothetical protein
MQVEFSVPLASILVAAIAPVLTFFLGLKGAKVEATTLKLDGFVKLVTSLQQEREELLRIVRDQLEENNRLRAIVKDPDLPIPLTTPAHEVSHDHHDRQAAPAADARITINDHG